MLTSAARLRADCRLHNLAAGSQYSMQLGSRVRQQSFQMRRHDDLREISCTPRDLVRQRLEKHNVLELGHSCASGTDLVTVTEGHDDAVHERAGNAGEFVHGWNG